MGKYGLTLAARVRAKTYKRLDGCWVWQAATTAAGYGVVKDRGKTLYVHRLAYERAYGPIPDGLELDHLCRNRACSNPQHLEAVTHRKNVLRGRSPTAVNARRTHCKYGHPFSGRNLYVDPQGRRGCRRCNADKQAALRRRRASTPNLA